MIQPSFTKIAITQQQIRIMRHIYYWNNHNNITYTENLFTNIPHAVCFPNIN